MAFIVHDLSGNQVGQVIDAQKFCVLSETDLAAASSTNLIGLLNYPASPARMPVLISVVCNASVAGSLFFDSNVAQSALTLPLVQGLNIFAKENSPLWFFDNTTVLNLTVNTATLSDIQLVMGVL